MCVHARVHVYVCAHFCEEKVGRGGKDTPGGLVHAVGAYSVFKEVESKSKHPVFCPGVKEVDFPLGGGGKEPGTGIWGALMSLSKDLLVPCLSEREVGPGLTLALISAASAWWKQGHRQN